MSKSLVDSCVDVDTAREIFTDEGNLLDELIALRDMGHPFVLSAIVPCKVGDGSESFATAILSSYTNTTAAEQGKIAAGDGRDALVATTLGAMRTAGTSVVSALNVAMQTGGHDVFLSIMDTAKDLRDYATEAANPAATVSKHTKH